MSPLAFPDELRTRQGLESVAPGSAGSRAADDTLAYAINYPSVVLFAQRASAVLPDFEINAENVEAVVKICRLLDGLPLAIELAAARISLLPPVVMLDRLASRLSLLTGGARDLPVRQRTLRNAIAWSYDLLDEGEKRLFRRVSVFAGGFTLISVADVGRQADEMDAGALDAVGSLLDKSLVYRASRVPLAPATSKAEGTGEREPRFAMLETIREFGLEALAGSGEAGAVRQAHADYFLRFAEAAEPELRGPEMLRQLNLLQSDYDNLRGALSWGLSQPDSDVGVRLAAALFDFWRLRGITVGDGPAWLELAAESGSAPKDSAVRGWVLRGRAGVNWVRGDYDLALLQANESATILRAAGDIRRLILVLALQGQILSRQGHHLPARAACTEAIALARDLGDASALANALLSSGIVESDHGELRSATAALEESRRLYGGLGDRWGLMNSVKFLALVAMSAGDYALARAFTREQVALARELENPLEVANGLANAGDASQLIGDYHNAAGCYVESLALYRELGLEENGASVMVQQGYLAEAQREHAAARQLLAGAIKTLRNSGDHQTLILCIAGLAAVAVATNQPRRAARLLAATQRALQESGLAPLPQFNAISKVIRTARERNLDPGTLKAAESEGRRLTLSEAADDAARSDGAPDPAERHSHPTARQAARQEYGGLTERERQVVSLVAEGKSNRAIAGELSVGVKTVKTYLTRILGKLGFSSRTQVATWAVHRGLARGLWDADSAPRDEP